MATVSIIIPVYNAEHTLERCVDSVLGQEFTDFELLLVDDGSSDGSPALCDRYAAQDSRVRVIHKENGGVSAARNAAMDLAEGEFLQFLDSDDWITPDATKLLLRSAREHQCDLVIADFYRVVGDRVSHKGGIEEDRVLSQEEFAGHMMENPADFYYGVIWNKLYRRSITEAHHLRMDTAISWCEDFIFNLEYIRHAQRFYALKAPIYYYVKTKGSLVSQSGKFVNAIRTKLRVFAYYNNFYKHVLDEEEYEKNRFQVYRFLLDSAGDGGVLPAILPGTQRLGDERTSVCAQAVEGTGILSDGYRNRKLLDRYLEIVALQNDLSLEETRLLLYLSRVSRPESRRNLADFADMSRRALSLTLQKLSAKGYIQVEERRPPREAGGDNPYLSRAQGAKELSISLLPAAQPVLRELETVQEEYDQTRFAGFTQEELSLYARLSEKIQENLRRVLQ